MTAAPAGFWRAPACAGLTMADTGETTSTKPAADAGPVGRAVLGYQSPAALRPPLWRRVLDAITLRRLGTAALALALVGGFVALALWVDSRPRAFEVRPLPVDGDDVVRATGMKLYKFQLTLPAGRWDVVMNVRHYLRRATTPTVSGSGMLGSFEDGDHPLLLYLSDGERPMVRITSRGTSVGVSRPAVGGDASTWNTDFAGVMRPGVPFAIYSAGWNDGPAPFRAISVPFRPGETDNGFDIVVTVLPAGSPPPPATGPTSN